MKLIEKSDGKWFLSVGDTDREIGYNRENNVTTIEIQTDITGYEFFLDFGFPDSTIASRILTKRDGLLSATLSAEYLSVDGTVCLQVKGVDTDGSIKKSNIIIVEVVKSVDETDPQQPPVYIWAQYINQVTELRDAAIEANKHGPKINMVNGHWEVYNAIEGKYEDTGIDARGGSGVPAGGSTHQVLAKKSDSDFDFEWIEVAVDVPTKTSDLINDSDFVSDEDYVHTDNNYSDVDKQNVGTISQKANIEDVENALSEKVDKVEGKQLSSNDFADIDKEKLDSLENYDDTEITERINNIESVIPNQATTDNQLADKDFVNSSISTNTAYFKGTYNSVQELQQVTATNNDYAIVIVEPQSGVTRYDRYKYNSETQQWVFEYSINNSSFTAEQWAAIQSGITEELVNGFSDHIDNENIHVTESEKGKIQEIDDKADLEDVYTKVQSDNLLNDKVDRVEGKGLSSNDFTNAEKTKLANLQNYDDTEVREEISSKQDKLTAGTNITIEDNVISASGGGTVDQHYNENSANAQSGKAVAEALAPINHQLDSSQPNTLASRVGLAISKSNNAIDMLGNVPETTTVQAEIEQKSDKTTIIASSDTTATVELLNNSEYRYINALSNLTITFPAEIPNDYITSVMFYSIGVPTNLTYPSGIKWSGDDIVSGEFVPASGKKYTLCLWYDGVMNGVVRGVSNE